MRQAKNFSYTKSVEKSKKKIMDNCTPQVEDLFAKIFTIDAEERINFADIRSHPVFSKYFPEVSTQSKILYKGKNKNKNRQSNYLYMRSSVIKTPFKNIKNPEDPLTAAGIGIQENATPGYNINREKMTEQQTFLEMEKDKLKFLYEMEEEIVMNSGTFMSVEETISLRYNLLKYYHILLNNFLAKLAPSKLEAINQKLDWK